VCHPLVTRVVCRASCPKIPQPLATDARLRASCAPPRSALRLLVHPGLATASRRRCEGSGDLRTPSSRAATRRPSCGRDARHPGESPRRPSQQCRRTRVSLSTGQHVPPHCSPRPALTLRSRTRPSVDCKRSNIAIPDHRGAATRPLVIRPSCAKRGRMATKTPPSNADESGNSRTRHLAPRCSRARPRAPALSRATASRSRRESRMDEQAERRARRSARRAEPSVRCVG